MNSIRRQLRSMLSVEPREGGFRARFTLASDFSLLADHFPNAPILPGMCLAQAILVAGAIARDEPNLHLHTLKNAKLVGPIFPGETVEIEADLSTDASGQLSIRAKITGDGKKKADLSLLAITGPGVKAVAS